jgi:hypothetical protein
MRWTLFEPLHPVLADQGIRLVPAPAQADVLVAKFWRPASVLKYRWLHGARRFLAWDSECNTPNATQNLRYRWLGVPAVDVMLPENGSIFREIGATFRWACLRKPEQIPRLEKRHAGMVVCMLGRNGTISENSRQLRPDTNDLRGVRLHLSEAFHAAGVGHIYGIGWPEYQRTEPDRLVGDWHEAKLPVCDNYDFAMAMENTLCPYYVTEKIWDAIQSDTVPIYYGSDWIYESFPHDSFLDVREFSSAPELIEVLRDMSAEEKSSRKAKCLAVYQRFVEEDLFAKADETLAHRTAARLQKICGVEVTNASLST